MPLLLHGGSALRCADLEQSSGRYGIAASVAFVKGLRRRKGRTLRSWRFVSVISFSLPWQGTGTLAACAKSG